MDVAVGSPSQRRRGQGSNPTPPPSQNVDLARHGLPNYCLDLRVAEKLAFELTLINVLAGLARSPERPPRYRSNFQLCCESNLQNDRAGRYGADLPLALFNPQLADEAHDARHGNPLHPQSRSLASPGGQQSPCRPFSSAIAAYIPVGIGPFHPAASPRR